MAFWFGSRSGSIFVGPDLGPNCLQYENKQMTMSPIAKKELRTYAPSKY